MSTTRQQEFQNWLYYYLKRNVTNVIWSGEEYKMRDEGVSELVHQLWSMYDIEYCDVSGNAIGIEGLRLLLGVLFRPTMMVNTLVLTNNIIGDVGAEELLTVLQSNSTLTMLALEKNNIGNVGAKSIRDLLLANTTLTDIDLSGNNIGNEGLKELMSAFKTNTTLKNLFLNENSIDDKGVEIISDALLTNITLTRLSVCRNYITDVGANVIITLIQNNATLENIECSDNYISEIKEEEVNTAIYDPSTSFRRIIIASIICNDAFEVPIPHRIWKEILSFLEINEFL